MKLLKKLGIKVGHYSDFENLTGATVFIPDSGADIGIDIRGSDTGTINTPAYDVKGADKLVKAIVLCGGSTRGLECAIGVMDKLDTPSVCGACIYDRKVGKDVRPKIKDGYKMAENASYDNLVQGNVGVGVGATTGKWKKKYRMKGGFGFSIKEVKENAYIGAFVVTNAAGNVIKPNENVFYYEKGGYDINDFYNTKLARQTNTTLAVIVTNIEMSKDELIKVSEMAHDGMTRSIYPVHTNYDGDIVFSISPHSKNRVKLKMNDFKLVNFVGIYAQNLLSEAIKNSVLNAESIEGFPSFAEKYIK